MAEEQARGDPEGRRVAGRRSLLLAEAGRLARALEVLVKRADEDPVVCTELVKHLAAREAIQLQRSYGRLESRKRFKKSSPQPIHDNRSLNCLFIDECGKSPPEPRLGATFFALSAVAMDEASVDLYRVRADELKMKHFGTTEITFHEPYMRFHDGPFYFSGDPDRQEEFDHDLMQLVADTDFVAFGTGIRKLAFERDFVQTGIDPYLPSDVYVVAITLLLERYIDYLATLPTRLLGRVTFESIGPLEDAQHQLEYARLLIEGSQWVPDASFRNFLETGLRFLPKSGSHPLELADIVSREVYEWMASDCTQEPRMWGLLKAKIHCRGDGRMGKFGIKIFPDSDIRDRIEKHRQECGADL